MDDDAAADAPELEYVVEWGLENGWGSWEPQLGSSLRKAGGKAVDLCENGGSSGVGSSDGTLSSMTNLLSSFSRLRLSRRQQECLDLGR